MVNRVKKNKVGSLAVIAILVRNYLRPRTLRSTLLDSLPFSTFIKVFLNASPLKIYFLFR
jgi:hypothetical protein